MVVIIPARGGSKGVPGKNIKSLGGKPLIQYTIDAAREVFKNSDIIVSTDSEEIRHTVIRAGLEVPNLRPAHLASDHASTREVLLYEVACLEEKGVCPNTIVLLQPTSPFRKSFHIKEAINLYRENLEMVVAVKETKANPYYLLKEENSEGFLENSKPGDFTRRQDCPQVWEINGAIYIINTSSLKSKSIKDFVRVKKYVMDEWSSHDIDTELDWLLAETLLEKKFFQNF